MSVTRALKTSYYKEEQPEYMAQKWAVDPRLGTGSVSRWARFVLNKYGVWFGVRVRWPDDVLELWRFYD